MVLVNLTLSIRPSGLSLKDALLSKQAEPSKECSRCLDVVSSFRKL